MDHTKLPYYRRNKSKMFGLIISGRPVDAAPQAISETQYAFQVHPAPAFNHIVVFLLPGTQLPPGTAASVYVKIPPSQEFRLLGGIGTGKESAIFKVSGGAAATGDIVVGISIEPAEQVEAQLANLKSGQQSSGAMVVAGAANGSPATTKVLAQRIIGNAFNFLASFGSDVVPLKAFQDWWLKFEKKVELDPSFLEREG
ncbi:hypothetical protein LTR27_002868 [Elasticomyces elasticus]|nr:hypothetical protein LTR27_002868 [Elasticomyces elasticus]